MALQPVVLDRHVLAFDGAGSVEAFAERRHVACGAIGRPAVDKRDYRQRRLLRARGERPCEGGAAEKRDEFAPPHSITSSAATRRLWGTVIASALAVLRLMT